MSEHFLNKHGQVVTKTYISRKKETRKTISWERMHELHHHKCTDKEEYEYIKKYLGKVSVFDWNNFKEYGYIQLTKHYQELAIENGAEDVRK